MMKPASAISTLLNDKFRRIKRRTHSATLNAMPSSKLQILEPEAIPNKRNSGHLLFGVDWIETNRMVSSGMERKYQEKPLTWKCHLRRDGVRANTTVAQRAVRSS